MINAFEIQNGRLVTLPVEDDPGVLQRAAWIDLVDPSDEERRVVEAMHLQALPDAEDVEELEASARSFEDEAGLHINSLFLQEVDGRARNMTVAFTISEQRLFTLRERETPAFRLLRLRARRGLQETPDPVSVLLQLFEIKVEGLADLLEEIYKGLEGVGQMVLEDPETDLEEAIDELARFEDINGKARLCLMDTQRAITFLIRRGRLSGEQAELAREILGDIDSLLPHNNFLFEKVNFLMDAALGFINIEQNQIIKIFSIAAVVFLPPTLVASLYGMNFQFMPELHWEFGYPMAIILMILAGLAPYWYFKRKGWL